ncbi:MAG: 30S ribosomal protein S4 [Nanoarchaeota archaeon]|nr:30S ribosomal protein S4 [Nanoarchaeota archaeon]
MGSPKKSRKKYKRPLVIWQSDLIREQKELMKEYGLKNKKEIWRTDGVVKKMRDQAKQLIPLKTEQAEKEKQQLITRLVKLGLVSPGAVLEDVLGLTTKDILERRLQTILFKRGLTKTPKQARQFIVHGHVAINEEKLNVPSFLVPLELEGKISFNPASRLFDNQHPERIKEKTRKEKKLKKENLDITDIFAGEIPEEKIKKEITKKTAKKEVKAAPKEQIPETAPKKEPIEEVDEVVEEENKTKVEQNVAEGKAK